MLQHPNCKLNIGLRVVGKRADGYHNIETLFYPVHALHDELEIEPSDVFSFVQEGISVDCPPEKNLIVRCYQQMRARYPQIGNVKIRFRKHIPFGAGLGGGSSDAAHTALALNELYRLGLSQSALAQEVSSLGADCPFFIYNTPCYAEGIGEQITPTNFSLHGMRLVLYKPDFGVSTREAYTGITLHPEHSGEESSAASDVYKRQSTREAYTGITLHPEHSGEMLQALLSGKSIKDIRDVLVNDFEQTIFPLYPEIARLKKQLLAAGAVYASMSGSGSTVFGLFDSEKSVIIPANPLIDTIL